jgi:hypothetical protein
MMLHGNGGFGYVRVDWFTPKGLGTGAMDACSFWAPRGTSNCASTPISPAGPAAITCSWWTRSRPPTWIAAKVDLPFGPQFVADIVNRTHVAQDQEQALLATELVLKAQKNARVLKGER